MHCITGLNTGGAEAMLCKVVSRLPEHGVECRVVSLLPLGPMAGTLQQMGVQVDSLGMKRGVPSPAALWRFFRLIRRWKPDVVQTWLYHADLLGLLAARMAGSVPVVWNIRCAYMDLSQYRRTTSLVLRLCSWLSRLPSAVLANSEEARRFHRELGYSPQRFEVIPNGFDTALFRPDPEAPRRLRLELGLEHANALIGLVARFDPMKDHATFLQAAGELVRSHAEVRFVLCGDGIVWSNEKLAAMVRENQLENRIFLLGRRNDIPQLTAGLDIAVCSSKGESFPNVVGEAMACGVPCAVTDVGDAASIIGDTGVVVPPEDVPALCQGMKSLLERGDAARRELGHCARERILSLYSLEKIVGLYYSLYEGVTGRTGESAPQ